MPHLYLLTYTSFIPPSSITLLSSYLDDFVSAGILIAFTTTNSSLLIMRRQSPESSPHLLQKLLGLFNLSSFLTCLSASHLPSPVNWVMVAILGCISILIARKIATKCPPIEFGGACRRLGGVTNNLYGDKTFFSTPLMPYIPCLGILINYLLICQLSFLGIVILFAYALLATLIYFMYGIHHSVGREECWEQQYSMCEAHDDKHQIPNSNNGVMT